MTVEAVPVYQKLSETLDASVVTALNDRIGGIADYLVPEACVMVNDQRASGWVEMSVGTGSTRLVLVSGAVVHADNVIGSPDTTTIYVAIATGVTVNAAPTTTGGIWKDASRTGMSVAKKFMDASVTNVATVDLVYSSKFFFFRWWSNSVTNYGISVGSIIKRDETEFPCMAAGVLASANAANGWMGNGLGASIEESVYVFTYPVIDSYSAITVANSSIRRTKAWSVEANSASPVLHPGVYWYNTDGTYAGVLRQMKFSATNQSGTVAIEPATGTNEGFSTAGNDAQAIWITQDL